MENENIKVIFFGTPEFAIPALSSLIGKGYSLAAVVTAPDKPAGRKKILTPPPVKVFAETRNIPVLQPENLRSQIFSDEFNEIRPDICIVAAYGKIIPEDYLAVPRFGFLNIHPSLLPKYRGPTPIQTAILNGDDLTGVSIMLLDAKVDHGAVLTKQTLQITQNDTYPTLSEKLAHLGAATLVEILARWVKSEVKPEEQNHEQATLTKIYRREDGRINWHKPAQEINNQIRALGYEPGTWTTWNGKTLNIFEASVYDAAVQQAGKIAQHGQAVLVSTGEKLLELTRIQLEGKRVMGIKEFLVGQPDFIGSILK